MITSHLYTNILYLENIKADLDTMGLHNINLKRPYFPQTVWLKDNEKRGRDIQKVQNYPFVKVVFWLKVLWAGIYLGISKDSNIPKI